MGPVDRIPPINPVLLQAQASSGVEMRKEGRNPSGEQPKRDKLELHGEDLSEEEAELEASHSIELFPEHGLDLSA